VRLVAEVPTGVSSLERVEAILRNPAIYELAEAIPHATGMSGGRPRRYPSYMLLVYDALISVYGSARRVEAELSHPLVWRFIRRLVRKLFPNDPDMHLPPQSMRRHHYAYGRNRYLCDPAVLSELSGLHRKHAADQARELGLFDPAGAGSWTHPDGSRILHADGKVVAPLSRAKPGETKVNRHTGEIRALRADPDAGLHFEGDGEAAWGTKFVLVAARTEEVHGRIIMDLEWVQKPGGEAAVAVGCLRRLAPLLPGAQAVVYDRPCGECTTRCSSGSSGSCR
jgi:hypothetical protein